MSKLQKDIAYRYNDHPVYKYRVNIPSDIVEAAGWQDGAELIFNVRKGKQRTKVEIISIPLANS